MKNKILLLLLLSTIPVFSIDIFQAIELGNKRVVNSWLRSVSDVSIVNDQGQTPLIVAAKTGNYQLVRRLLRQGAKIDIVDDQGFDALDWALHRENKKIIAMLTHKKKFKHLELKNKKKKTRIQKIGQIFKAIVLAPIIAIDAFVFLISGNTFFVKRYTFMKISF